MAGGNNQHKPSATNPSATATATTTAMANRKPATATTNSKHTQPTTSTNPKLKHPAQDHGPPPPPVYGFHMLERRTIVIFDGSVRTYFALPSDYQDFPPRFPVAGEFGNVPGRFPPGVPMSPDGIGDVRGRPMSGPQQHQQQDYWNSLGLDGQGGMLKRKYGDEEVSRPMVGREFSKGGTSGSREEDLRGGKLMRVSAGYDGTSKVTEVDPSALKKVFLYFVKTVNADTWLKKKYLENGKMGALKCLVCGRSSKDFPDMHALIMHTYNSENADHVDHLGLHKALCILMGWNFSKPPDNSKAYQFLPAGEAVANQEDLIIWPPTVIIHNTFTGKNKDGRMEGLGNKAMDMIIGGLGCFSGKSSALYGREGHMGITLVKFAADQSGLSEAVRFAEYFEKENRGRKSWDRLQPIVFGKDDEKNPDLMKVDERNGEKKRIFYGYLATASDLDKLNFEMKKKVSIESRREYMLSK